MLSIIDKWTHLKPLFTTECLLITAVKVRGEWEYNTYQIKLTTCEDRFYMGWLTGDGEEYGDLADLKADMYLELPLLD